MEAPADCTWTGFSLAERDRRWAAVRANAAQAGLDCVFVPLCVDGTNLRLSLESARGTRSDCRYLTQMDNAAIILPTDGRVPIVVNDRGGSNAWIAEARAANRSGRGSWSSAVIAALHDAGMERARIGVSGLTRGKITHARAVEGVVNHSCYAEVVTALPNATFFDATDVVGFARYVKSAEEIACLERGAQIATVGIEEMVRSARPGVTEAQVYANVMRSMLELGSEYYPLAWYCGPIGEAHARMENPPPPDRVLQPMDLITNEVDAVWGGLISQEQQPILLGAIPDEWKPVVDLQRDLFRAGLEYMTPGREFADMIDFVNGFGARRGMHTLILMHGRGYGNDGPLLTPQDRGDRVRDVRVELGNVWVWKPIAYSADQRIQFSWGGVVEVTARGGRQLAARMPQLISVQ